MTHAEMTKHIRKRIKAAGINARVNKMTICGADIIKVSTITFRGNEFTASEQVMINHIAKCNGLTISQGMEINIDTPFGDSQEFIMPRS